MHKTQWKQKYGKRGRFQTPVPKIRRFDREDNQPHGRESYTVMEWRKRKGIWVTVTYTRFCSCKACQAYLALLWELNPARANALTEHDGEPPKFQKPKALPEHVHVRRRLAQSIGKWK